MEFLDKRFLGNSLSFWIWAGVTFILVVIRANWLKRIIRSRLTRGNKPIENLQETINLNLLRKFSQEGIEFAYPTQTVFTGKTV